MNTLNLIAQLKKWHKEGNRLVVCLDANKDIYKKSLGKSLTNRDGLGMLEVVGDFTGTKIEPTFFHESKPINGILATQDVVVTHACGMLAGYGVGDHQLFIVDFQEKNLVGVAPFHIKCFASRHLNTKMSSGATQKYLKRLEGSLLQHCLIKCLSHIHLAHKSRCKFQKEFNKLDKQSKDIMINGEKKCWQIKSDRIPFSPQAALWIC